MQLKCKIYVIIPVFNAAEYLRQAVISVLAQNANNHITIILVDDGSTDGSSELCDCLAAEYSDIVVLHQKNSGVSAARNKGLRYVLSICNNKQDYITFLDSDDMWYKGAVNDEVVSLLSRGYDLVGLQTANCNNDLTRMSVLSAMNEGEHQDGKNAIWLHAQQHFGAMFYSCRLLVQYKIEFHEELSYTEDKLFRMSCMYVARTIYLKNRLLYLYRCNGKSLIHTRQYGIRYFKHIINEYLTLDEDMAPYYSVERGVLSEGKMLANIYVMDMADEHFLHFGRKKDFISVLESNPRWRALVEGEIEGIPANEKYLQFCNNPLNYMVKRYVKGILWLILHILLKYTPVNKIRSWHRFPIRTNNCLASEVENRL